RPLLLSIPIVQAPLHPPSLPQRLTSSSQSSMATPFSFVWELAITLNSAHSSSISPVCLVLRMMMQNQLSCYLDPVHSHLIRREPLPVIVRMISTIDGRRRAQVKRKPACVVRIYRRAKQFTLPC